MNKGLLEFVTYLPNRIPGKEPFGSFHLILLEGACIVIHCARMGCHRCRAWLGCCGCCACPDHYFVLTWFSYILCRYHRVRGAGGRDGND